MGDEYDAAAAALVLRHVIKSGDPIKCMRGSTPTRRSAFMLLRDLIDLWIAPEAASRPARRAEILSLAACIETRLELGGYGRVLASGLSGLTAVRSIFIGLGRFTRQWPKTKRTANIPISFVGRIWCANRSLAGD
jgi:hypothetical protein